MQVDGKVRARIRTSAGASSVDLEGAALADAAVQAAIGDRAVGRVIVVPGRLVNVVTG